MKRSSEGTCCQDVYCPGFIYCFFVPTPGPSSTSCNCDCDCCNCLPPTSACACCGGDGHCNNIGDCGGGGDSDNPVVFIVLLIMLALILVALIGVIAFLIYRMVSFPSMVSPVVCHQVLPCLVGWWQVTSCCKTISHICSCICSGGLYHYDSSWNCSGCCICLTVNCNSII